MGASGNVTGGQGPGLRDEGTIPDGRLQRDSATQISYQRYKGDVVGCGGEKILCGSAGLTRTTSQNLISSTGTDSGAGPGASTLYYAYISNSKASYAAGLLALSATAPTRLSGTYYLATSGNGANWRFVGWVYTDASTNFQDSVTQRLVVNYYNRVPASLYVSPGYSDDNGTTTWTTASRTWTQANGGTGSRLAFIATGEDDVCFFAATFASTTSASDYAKIGISNLNSTSTCARSIGTNVTMATGAYRSGACYAVFSPSVGYNTVDILVVQGTDGTATFLADDQRYGGTADSATTYIEGMIVK